MNSINDKLKALRKLMKKEKIHAYIIPTNGPHKSEYVTEHWSHREWISGFTGSAGTVVVTLHKAGLWTDARYFQQGEEQLADSEMNLFKMGGAGVPSFISWLGDELSDGNRVAGAALTTMTAQRESYKTTMAKKGIKFVVTEDLVGAIRQDRPELLKDKIFEHDVKFAGLTRKEKLKLLRKKIKSVGAEATLVTALDEIGWLLNLRGRDVAFNPVFYSYLWVEKKQCVLFVDKDKVDVALQIELAIDNIQIAQYDKVYKRLKMLSKKMLVAIDSNAVNAEIFDCLKAKKLIELDSPVKHLKAIKNPTEIKHLKQVMVKDGVALANAFRWLEITLSARTVSEFEFGEKLAEYRAQQKDYFGESFNPIVGHESNGAIMHYRADAANCKQIKKEGVLLVDSGGQYLDGTTDITRTFALSDVGDEKKKHYTLVLKGHIALATAHFPEGTTGIQLDALARQFLWKHDLDFGHGTGHGVGFFMNVHEPPQGFAPKLVERGTTGHKAGMYSSNEPGYYKVGSHGIRLENLVISVRSAEGSGFLRHETITLYPFDLNFIDRTLMTNAEIAWLNSYHRKVEKKLTPHLDEETAAWIVHQCRPLV